MLSWVRWPVEGSFNELTYSGFSTPYDELHVGDSWAHDLRYVFIPTISVFLICRNIIASQSQQIHTLLLQDLWYWNQK